MPITVVRRSDGEFKIFDDVTPETTVQKLILLTRKELPPPNEKSQLVYADKVLKKKLQLKDYDIENGQLIELVKKNKSKFNCMCIS